MAIPISARARAIIAKMKAPGNFTKLLPWDTFFDPTLARSTSAQRSAEFYQPLLERAIDESRTSMAQRGLFRSGIRRQGEERISEEVADQEAQMIEDLYNTREGEVLEEYAGQQAIYDDDPTGYKRPKETARQRTLAGQPATDYYAWRKDRFGSSTPVNYKYGLGTTENAPYKYGQSYLDWWKKKFNKNPYSGEPTGRAYGGAYQDSSRSLSS